MPPVTRSRSARSSPSPTTSARDRRAISRAASAGPLAPIEEEDAIMAPRSRATPSAFRPTIPVAVSAGYGSPGKLGSPSRRVRAQAQTGGDLAADVASRLTRLSEEPGPVADEHVMEEEVSVPIVEEKGSKGTKDVIGNDSFGIEAGVGRSAAVEEVVSTAPPRDESVSPIVEFVEEIVPVSTFVWSSQRTTATLLACWLLFCPLLAGILSVTHNVPWLATTKSLATFGAFPAPSYLGNLNSFPVSSRFGDLDIENIHNNIDGIHNDISHLRAQVNTLSSKIPAKGVSTQFSGGLPAHIVPSYGSTRVNLFANNFGTVIDPYLTSSSRIETVYHDNFFLRWLYPEGDNVALTYSPSEALGPWEDLGDCWCSSIRDTSNTASATDSTNPSSSNGLAQIAMILPQPIIPTDLIIEHIEKDRTIDSDSTPRDFELLIQVKDPYVRETIELASRNWLTGIDSHITPQMDSSRWETERHLDETWVKVGSWTYDLHSAHNVQSFRIPRWLGEFGRFGVTKVVVRTRSNWGNSPFTCFYRLKMFGHILKEA